MRVWTYSDIYLWYPYAYSTNKCVNFSSVPLLMMLKVCDIYIGLCMDFRYSFVDILYEVLLTCPHLFTPTDFSWVSLGNMFYRVWAEKQRSRRLQRFATLAHTGTGNDSRAI